MMWIGFKWLSVGSESFGSELSPKLSPTKRNSSSWSSVEVRNVGRSREDRGQEGEQPLQMRSA
jgi:hypothetical protein